jgi:hypothetical protein
MSSIKITKFHLYMSSILITKLQLHKSSTRHSYKIANLLSIHIHVTRVSLINHYLGDHTHSTSKYQISSPYTNNNQFQSTIQIHPSLIRIQPRGLEKGDWGRIP